MNNHNLQSEKRVAVTFGELWSIQESLLQAYRIIFFTIESIMLASCAILLSLEHANEYIGVLLAIAGIGLVFIWREVCNARANAVAFIHWLIQKHESGELVEQPYTYFREFQHDRTFKGQNVLMDSHFKKLCQSKTRRRMDKQAPMVFMSLWILVLVKFLLDLTVNL